MATPATPERQEAERFADELEDLFYLAGSATMAPYYAEDARIMAQHEETDEGRLAIERFWRTTREGARSVQMERTIDVHEVEASGGLGYVRGVVTLRYPKPKARDHDPVQVHHALEARGQWRVAVGGGHLQPQRSA